jgi:hypothetical protein
MKSQRRQVGGRYLARARGAFRGGQARPWRRVGVPANPEPDGATRGTGAQTVAGSRVSQGEHPTLDFLAGRRRPSAWRLFAGPEIDRRRPRVEMVRKVPESRRIQ